MASSDQLVMSEVKIEIDIAEEPAPPWRSQHHCSGSTSDWSENGVSSTITPCETNCWNPSATTMKCEPVSQPASTQGIKAEPDLDWQTGSTGGNVISDGAVTTNTSCDIVKIEVVSADIRKDVVQNEAVSTTIGDDIKTELLTENSSNDVIRTETATTNISSDVQTEAVTDIMMTVTCDAVRSEAISSRDEEKNRPAGDKQNKGSCIRTTPQPSASGRTSVHQSANTSGSLLPLTRSPVCRHCSAAFVLLSSLKRHMASVHGVFPESSTPESCDVGHCGNMDIEKNLGDLGDRKTVERKKNQPDNKETDGTDLVKDSRRHVQGDANHHLQGIAGVKASENGIDLGVDPVIVEFRTGGYRDINGLLVVNQLLRITGSSHQSPPLSPQQKKQEKPDDPSPFKWTHQAILLLISEHKEKQPLFASSAMRRVEVWQLIATVMREHGHKASADACDKKWRNLRATYKNIREKQQRTGAGRITWEYYDHIDDQLSHDPSVLPKKTFGSLSGVSIVSERPRAFTTPNPSSSSSPNPEQAEGSDAVSGTSTTPNRKRKGSPLSAKKRADEPPRWIVDHLQKQTDAMTALQKSMDRRNDILEALVQTLNK